MVDLILQKEPDLINQISYSPLRSSGNDALKSPLQSAFDSASPRMLRRILQEKPDLNQLTLKDFRISDWAAVDEETFPLLFKKGLDITQIDRFGHFLLTATIRQNKPAFMHKVIEALPEPLEESSYKTKALHFAIETQKEEIALSLLKKGVKPCLDTTSNPYHDTLFLALNYACPAVTRAVMGQVSDEKLNGAYGEKLLKNLIKAHADLSFCNRFLPVDRTIDGMPALIYALSLKAEKDADSLLNLGVKTDGADKDGNTALMWAVRHEMMRITKKLLAAGVALDTVNSEGYTAFESALDLHHPAFADAIWREEKRRRTSRALIAPHPLHEKHVLTRNKLLREREN